MLSFGCKSVFNNFLIIFKGYFRRVSKNCAECVKINNDYRKQYSLDEREVEQHVNYGQTEEEQQDPIH